MTIRAHLLALLVLSLTAGGVRAVGVGDAAPAITARDGLNTPALTAHDVDGKVVLIELEGTVNISGRSLAQSL